MAPFDKSVIRTVMAGILTFVLLAAAWASLIHQWAIIQGMWMAFGSVPEMGMLDVRIDAANAELMTHGDALRRFHDGNSSYDPSRDSSDLDWWVEIRGDFRYQSLGFIGETDNRIFLFDAFTGRWIGISGFLPAHSTN